MYMIQAYSPSTFPQRPAKVGKTIEKWILYLAILGIAGISLYWFVLGKGKTFEVSLVAKKGSVEYRENEKGEWKTINELPLKINTSSEVRTLADSDASFTITDGSKIQLGSYSRIVLAGNQGEINWVQTDGDSHHQTGKNADRKSYKVSISDGVIESQGTAFEVKIKESDTIILALKDQITITYKDKSTSSAKAGEEVLMNPVGRKVKEIDDHELQEVWTLENLKDDQKNGLPIDEKVLAKAGLSSVIADNEAEQATTQPEEITTEAEEKPTEGENKPSEATGQSDIALQVKQSPNGVLLSWTGGQGDRESWKVLRGAGSDITYPNDSYRTVSKDESSYLWEISGDSNTYYYRICAFQNDKGCIGYSNSQSLASNATQSTSNDSSVTENTESSATTSQNANTTKKSGTTTRKQCENSGGHWTKASGACKCPAKEVFVTSVGRCQKK